VSINRNYQLSTAYITPVVFVATDADTADVPVLVNAPPSIAAASIVPSDARCTYAAPTAPEQTTILSGIHLFVCRGMTPGLPVNITFGAADAGQ